MISVLFCGYGKPERRFQRLVPLRVASQYEETRSFSPVLNSSLAPPKGIEFSYLEGTTHDSNKGILSFCSKQALFPHKNMKETAFSMQTRALLGSCAK